MSDKSKAMAEVLEAAGINIRYVHVLGSYVHINSYRKYHDKIVDVMTTAGFRAVRISDGHHLDGSHGYRASFTA